MGLVFAAASRPLPTGTGTRHRASSSFQKLRARRLEQEQPSEPSKVERLFLPRNRRERQFPDLLAPQLNLNFKRPFYEELCGLEKRRVRVDCKLFPTKDLFVKPLPEETPVVCLLCHSFMLGNDLIC